MLILLGKLRLPPRKIDLLALQCMMGKFVIIAEKWRSQPITMTKRSKKVRPVVFVYKFWQDISPSVSMLFFPLVKKY